MIRIGTVQILKDRYYNDTPHGDVLVPAGSYPVEYENGYYFFSLSGYPAAPAGAPERIGQGLFLIAPSDRVKSTRAVSFRREIRGDWEEFLSSLLCQEGSEQRLRIRLDQEIVS